MPHVLPGQLQILRQEYRTPAISHQETGAINHNLASIKQHPPHNITLGKS